MIGQFITSTDGTLLLLFSCQGCSSGLHSSAYEGDDLVEIRRRAHGDNAAAIGSRTRACQHREGIKMRKPDFKGIKMRKPDFIIGSEDAPYLLRWWVIPRNRFFNIYLHQILRSDDDRALHDHPWWNVSLILKGGYYEYTTKEWLGSFVKWRGRGAVVFRRATLAHRLELFRNNPCWSLFITGPRIREWGFHCPKGWRHWREFVSVTPGGNAVGRGCGE